MQHAVAPGYLLLRQVSNSGAQSARNRYVQSVLRINSHLNPSFRQLISSLSAVEREFFRFPPAGHPYYTSQTLAALEEQYPGWNVRGEYAI